MVLDISIPTFKFMTLRVLHTASKDEDEVNEIPYTNSTKGEKKRIITNALQVVGIGVLVAIGLYVTISSFITIPYGIYVIGGIVTGVMTIIANLVLIVAMGMGAEGMLLAIVIANFIGAVYLFIALKLRRYIGVGVGDRTIITIVLGVAANGVYAVAYRFPLIFNGLFSFFGMSWTESASMHINSPDRDKYFSQVMNTSLKMFAALGAFIIAAVPFVFNLFVNEEFVEAYQYIPILIIGAFFNSIVGLYSAIYIAKKLTKQVFTTSLIAAAINISFTLIFIHWIGIYAAAIAMGVAFLSMAIFRHYDMKKYVIRLV